MKGLSRMSGPVPNLRTVFGQLPEPAQNDRLTDAVPCEDGRGSVSSASSLSPEANASSPTGLKSVIIAPM